MKIKFVKFVVIFILVAIGLFIIFAGGYFGYYRYIKQPNHYYVLYRVMMRTYPLFIKNGSVFTFGINDPLELIEPNEIERIMKDEIKKQNDYKLFVGCSDMNENSRQQLYLIVSTAEKVGLKKRMELEKTCMRILSTRKKKNASIIPP